jgi:hypothetical protein
MTFKTYKSFPTGEERELQPADDQAMSFFQRLKAALDAEASLEKAQKDVPSYTAQFSDLDYTGDAENEFNRAVDNLYDCVKDAANEAADERSRQAAETY